MLILLILLLTSCSSKKVPEGAREKVFFGGAKPAVVDDFAKNYRILLPNVGADLNPTFSGNLDTFWKQKVGRVSTSVLLASSPIVHDGFVVTQDVDSLVKVFDAKTGSLIWQKYVGDKKALYKLGGGLAAYGSTVVSALPTGSLVCLDIRSGAEIWRTVLNDHVRSAPVFNDKFCFVTTLSQRLVCLSMIDGSERWSDASQQRSTSVVGSPAPLLLNNNVIVPHISGEINALRQENGHVHWRSMVHAEPENMVLEEFLSWYAPLVYDVPALYASHPSGSLIALDVRTGAEDWKVSAAYLCAPALGLNVIFSLDSMGKVLCIEKKKGHVLWIEQLPSEQGEQWFGPVLGGGMLVFLSTGGSVLLMNPENGSIIKKKKISGSAFFKPAVIQDGFLYAINQKGEMFAVQ